jgi:protease-4
MSWLDEEVARIHKRQRKRKNRPIFIIFLVFFVIAFVLSAVVIFTYTEDTRTVVVRVEGTLVTGLNSGSGFVGSEYVGRQLRDAADNPLVEAIVIRVNSPGGTPSAAQEIIRDIEYARQRKPVVVSMGDIAASAAYHVCSHADLIYANPDTLTGSIGSIWIFYDVSKNLEDEGISVDIVKSGDKKDMTSAFRPLSDEERSYAQELVNDSYELFIADIIEQRGVDRDLIEDARLFRGEEAMELGLIDRMGNLFDAIDGAKKLAASPTAITADLPS